MFELNGKGALVTGASGGIGGAIARMFHGAGATVAISGRQVDRLETLASELGDRVHVLPCDLSKRAEVTELADKAEETLGHVDILVNNGGVRADNLIMRMKDDEWDIVSEVNLTAAFVLIRGTVRNMIRRRFGRIINMSSVSAMTGLPGQANYSSAKAGLIGMTKAVAREFAPRGITANCIAPGYIQTEMTSDLTDKQVEVFVSAIPSGKAGTVDDIAAAALYLASEEAQYVTGITLHVNGGMYMP